MGICNSTTSKKTAKPTEEKTSHNYEKRDQCSAPSIMAFTLELVYYPYDIR